MAERKEARGETAQQDREGRSRVSAPAMGGQNATRTKVRGRRSASPRGPEGGATKHDLYQRARARGIPGRSKMSKRQLENALR